jgi:hypothetical protein
MKHDPYIVVRRSKVYAPAWVTPWLITTFIIAVPLVVWAILQGIKAACS